MRGDKEKFNYYVSGHIMKRFRDMAYLKHGCIYGAVSFELEAAMNERLAAFKNGDSTHTHFASKALELKNKIKDHLISKRNYDPSFSGVIIAKSMLVEAIIAVEGIHDMRPINDRIRLLKSKGCIKESEDSDKLHRRYLFVSDGEYLKKQEMQ